MSNKHASAAYQVAIVMNDFWLGDDLMKQGK